MGSEHNFGWKGMFQSTSFHSTTVGLQRKTDAQLHGPAAMHRTFLKKSKQLWSHAMSKTAKVVQHSFSISRKVISSDGSW